MTLHLAIKDKITSASRETLVVVDSMEWDSVRRMSRQLSKQSAKVSKRTTLAPQRKILALTPTYIHISKQHRRRREESQESRWGRQRER